MIFNFQEINLELKAGSHIHRHYSKQRLCPLQDRQYPYCYQLYTDKVKATQAQCEPSLGTISSRKIWPERGLRKSNEVKEW